MPQLWLHMKHLIQTHGTWNSIDALLSEWNEKHMQAIIYSVE